jgi:hypothetical protein
MKELTEAERIAKLPAWAREKIETLERERSIAVRDLTAFLDKQTPSDIYVEEYRVGQSVGELRPTSEKIYVQGHHVTINAHGVELRVSTKYGSTNDDSIVLQWAVAGLAFSGEVAMVPLSFQQVRLLAKEKMR